MAAAQPYGPSQHCADGRGTGLAASRLIPVTEYREVNDMNAKLTMNTPSPEDMRHPKPGLIDQRQQRIDPANKHTVDPNERPEDNTKQPGELGDEVAD